MNFSSEYKTRIGPVELTMRGAAEDAEGAAKVRRIIELASSILKGPTFLDLVDVKEDAPCGCSGS